MELEIKGSSGNLQSYQSQSSTKVKHAGQGSQVLIANFGFPVAKPLEDTDIFHKELVERLANQSGWTVLSMVCSGLDGSSGKFSPKNWCDDLESVAQYFVENYKVKSVLLFGYDFAANVCLYVASKSSYVRGVATVSPLLSLDAYVENPEKLQRNLQEVGIRVPRKGSDISTWSDQLSELQLSRLSEGLGSKQWLVVHGRDDEIVPESELKEFLALHGSLAETHFISAGDHQLVTDPRMMAILLGWMERNS